MSTKFLISNVLKQKSLSKKLGTFPKTFNNILQQKSTKVKIPSIISRSFSTQTIPMMNNSGTYKTSTGLVGLAVDGDALNTVYNLSQDVLESVKKIPPTSQYRIDVEKWFNFISKTVSTTEDFKAAEEEIGLGQLEEVADMARDELELIDFYYENKGWELVQEAKLYADDMVTEMADSIYFNLPRDGSVVITKIPPSVTAATSAASTATGVTK